MNAYPSFGPGAEAHSLTTDYGVTMRVVIEGQGPDIVFIPGGDTPAEGYTQLFKYLSNSFRCIAYDPRGAGETFAPPPPWTMSDYARDCAAVIDAFCESQAVVCGLSLGGLVTQATAIEFPDKVRMAIPMGTAAYIDGFTRDWMQAEIDIRKAGITLPDYFLAPHYAVYAFPAAALGDHDLWEEIKTAYTARFSGRDPQDTIDQWEACLEFDCRDALKTCSVPFHVIAFSQDIQTPPAMCKVVSDLAMQGHFYEIEGLGHVSMSRHKPDVVAKQILSILETEQASAHS
jgi:pimeloyl-ACP methyl ester carboxylesterase